MIVRTLALTTVAAAFLALAPAAHAQYSPEYDHCIARAHNNLVQNGMCDQVELGKQDARLNKAYQQVMSQFPPNDPKRIELRDSERKWLKERDYSCKIDGQTIDDGCLMKKTASPRG